MNITFDLSKIVSVKFVEKQICDYYKIEPEIKLFGKVIFPKMVKGIGEYYSFLNFKDRVEKGEIKGIIIDEVIYQKPFLSLTFLNGDIHKEFFDSDTDAHKHKFIITMNMVKPMEYKK